MPEEQGPKSRRKRTEDLVTGEALPAEPPAAEAPASGPEPKVEVFRGQRVSVFRIDGRDYPSDDPALSPQMRQLFSYLDEHGVTPGLLECLRQIGQDTRTPPGAAAVPSEGDLAFWKSTQCDPVPGLPAQMEEDGDPEGYGRLRRALSRQRGRLLPAAAAIGLYAAARLLFHSQIRVVDEIISTVLTRLLLPF